MIITPILGASTLQIVLLVVLAAVCAALIFLTLWGNKQQKKNEEAQAQLNAAARPTTMLVIDKKRMKLKDAGLPKLVMDNVPKRMRGSKVPVVKCKIGPSIQTLLCEDEVFDTIPVKQEIKAMVSGIYIISVKSIRGSLEQKPEKLTLMQKIRRKAKGL